MISVQVANPYNRVGFELLRSGYQGLAEGSMTTGELLFRG